MRALLYLLSLLATFASAICAQGVINKSLLRAPSDRAVATWTTRTFELVQASVVYIAIEVDGPRGKFVIERAGSGVIVDRSGLVLTFQHLVKELAGADDKRLLVQLNDAGNTQLPAKVLAHDVGTGLALLQVTPPAHGLHVASLGSDRPHVGEPVLVVARPDGKDMLAFAGVASNALAPVVLAGQSLGASDVFMTDARSDERCDGAAVFGADGSLLGLYASEHVKRDVREPTLEDLQLPSFALCVPAGRVRGAFASSFASSLAAASNESLKRAPARSVHAVAKAVARVAPSVVAVYSGEGDWPVLEAKDPGCGQRYEGLGSAVVLSKGGLLVANTHACRGSGELRVKVAGKVYPAQILKSNGGSNLSLLQVALPASIRLQPAVCAPNGEVALGETVLAVGNPMGGDVVVSAGVVSAMRGREGGRIQADANLGNANGGGAVIDVTGRVIGISDAGRIDAVEMAYSMRGDDAQQENNLSTFVGIRQVRKVFGHALRAADATGESILAPVAANDAQQQQRASALRQMVAKTNGAMLNIYVARNAAVADPDDPFPPEPQWRTLSLGSGVIIDRSGLAISNWHVVDAGTNPDGSSDEDYRITARVFGGREYEVRVLSISREDDLSLLQLVLDPGEEVPAVELGNSDALRIGQAVAAIGNPHGRANTITYGVVSAKGQGIRVKGRFAKLKHLMETDAAINGGNSGGALLDMSGRLVGINSAGGGTFNNVGYAIAVDHVRRQITSLLMQPYKLRSVDLGMRIIDQDGKVLVMDVDERGPAAAAGVKPGDRIASLAGTSITWGPGFAKTLMMQEPDVKLPLVVDRQGASKTLLVEALRPEVWGVIRQSGLRVRDLGYVEDAERVRLASIALHRAFTGDKAAEPQQIPTQVVTVDRVFKQNTPHADIQAGDLILAIELRTRTDARPLLQPIASVVELRDWFNNRQIGSYDGVEWRCWIARGEEVKAIDLVAKRLFW